MSCNENSFLRTPPNITRENSNSQRILPRHLNKKPPPAIPRTRSLPDTHRPFYLSLHLLKKKKKKPPRN